MIQNSPQAADTQSVAKVVVQTDGVDEQRRRLASIKRSVRRQTSGAVQELRVEVTGDTVVLQGRCTNFYCKQKAQHAAMKYLKGETLVNKIEVAALPR